MIGYCWLGRDTRWLAIGWCCEVPFRLMLELRLSQMMADDWVVPWCHSGYHLLSLCDKAVPSVLWGPWAAKMGTTALGCGW